MAIHWNQWLAIKNWMAGNHHVHPSLKLMGFGVPSISYHYHIIIKSHHITSHHTVSLSYHIISYHIISSDLISYHLISYHIISYHIISYHIISSHIISSHLISYHIISSHIISSHLISLSYHIISHWSISNIFQVKVTKRASIPWQVGKARPKVKCSKTETWEVRFGSDVTKKNKKTRIRFHGILVAYNWGIFHWFRFMFFVLIYMESLYWLIVLNPHKNWVGFHPLDPKQTNCQQTCFFGWLRIIGTLLWRDLEIWICFSQGSSGMSKPLVTWDPMILRVG